MTATLANARDAAILSLAPLVARLSARVAYYATGSAVCDKADLASAGWIAAIRVVDTYDPARGVPLEGYAHRVILGAVFNELRRCDPVSERDRRTVRSGLRARFALAQTLGREPTYAEIEARVPGFAKATVRCQSILSLSESPGWKADDFVTDLTIEGHLPGDTDVEALIDAHEERAAVRGALDRLDARRRTVVEAHYLEDRSLREIAENFKVSPQRVSQLRSSALAAMRRHLAVVA